MNKLSDDELLAALGVEREEQKQKTYSAVEERVIAGFEDIVHFFDEHGRVPRHGEQNDIFERLYAVRLDRLCEDAHWREFLLPFDEYHLLDEVSREKTETIKLDDDALLTELGVEPPSEDSIENLRHVRPHTEKTQPEEIASRKPVEDFGEFKPLFDAVQRDLANAVRKTRPFQRDVEIRKGDFFILYGQLAYVAELGKPFITEYGRPDRRSRVIFSNETESDLLLRSLQRALYRDETSRRISEPEAGPLFSGEIEADDLASGTIYVLRSNSQFPLIKQNRNMIHKIGVTGGSVEKRIADAKHDPTYLMDDVEIVATYELYNISRTKTEKLLHRVFRKAQFDAKIIDRFGKAIYPREWFLVPLPIIDEVIEKIKDKSLPKYEYEPQEGRLKLIDEEG
ncbi:GIY-YIG nuclease family protein [Bartonella apis]|uniref:GIY-YIG nuclease family protein n=1 Tax=Bartonella apis TaxID=1686310 RepID=UPI0026EDDEC8|nr:GIY-YIG nuclease family protein [Bartonella apis]